MTQFDMCIFIAIIIFVGNVSVLPYNLKYVVLENIQIKIGVKTQIKIVIGI